MSEKASNRAKQKRVQATNHLQRRKSTDAHKNTLCMRILRDLACAPNWANALNPAQGDALGKLRRVKQALAESRKRQMTPGHKNKNDQPLLLVRRDAAQTQRHESTRKDAGRPACTGKSSKSSTTALALRELEQQVFYHRPLTIPGRQLRC